MKAVVDGFEGNKARLEVIGTKEKVVVDRVDLPHDAGEGSVVDNAGGTWELDIKESAKRREKSANLVNSLLK